MTSRATVRRKSGATTTDADGLRVTGWTVVHTALPFRIDGTGAVGDGRSRGANLGGVVSFAQVTALGHMPADTTDLEDGDLVEITSGEWAASVWRVVAAVVADQKTARRVPIEAVPRPSEWV